MYTIFIGKLICFLFGGIYSKKRAKAKGQTGWGTSQQPRYRQKNVQSQYRESRNREKKM
ncbi:MAG: hypothetical protein R6U96_07070 [Promethearchaeia archaeon]